MVVWERLIGVVQENQMDKPVNQQQAFGNNIVRLENTQTSVSATND